MKLFLLTTSESCAADLPYGDDELTPEDSLAYFSMSEKGTYHNAWQQVILPTGRWSGDDVDYIMWNFDSVKTVEERLKSAAAFGEVVHWVIEHKEKTIYKNRYLAILRQLECRVSSCWKRRPFLKTVRCMGRSDGLREWL